MNVNVTKPVIIDAVDYENTPSIDFDLGSLNSFNLTASPRFLSPPTNHKHPKRIKILSPNSRKKILANVNNKLNQISNVTTPSAHVTKDNIQNENNLGAKEAQTQSMDVNKSLHSVSSLCTESTTIDLETEYDAIAVGKLKSLQLFDKKIHSFQNIENLDRAYNLIELNLHSNFISKIEMIDSLTKLRILNLSSNQIQNIEGLQSLHALQELNLSSNRITNIKQSCFSSHVKLTKLILSYNYIQDISALNLKHFQSNGVPVLRYLDIKCNKITDVKQLEHLQHIESLQTLVIEDDYSSKSLSNPICNAEYKHIVADALPHLKWLNMQLFDAESNASKIKLHISSPPTAKNKKKKEIENKSLRNKKRERANVKVSNSRNKNKIKQIKKKKKVYKKEEVASSSSYSEDSESENDALPTSIKPRLLSPPKPITKHKEEKKKNKKKNKRKIKQHQSHKIETNEAEKVGHTSRIDAILNRFHKRSTDDVYIPVIKPQPHIAPVLQHNHVHIPSVVPLAAYQTAKIPPERIDFLVERLEKLFPNMNKENNERMEDKKEEELVTETKNIQNIDVVDKSEEKKEIQNNNKTERGSQTTSNKILKYKLSQDITNDFHINFGWNVVKQESDWREREKQIEEKYVNEMHGLKQHKVDLENRLKTLQNELQGNMEKNKYALQQLEAQININNKAEIEKKALKEQLVFRSNQVNESMQEMQRMQIEYKEKNELLQKTSNECKQSQFELSEIKKSVKDFDENNKMTNRVQTDRINELISKRNQDHEKLLLSQQRNQLLNAEIRNLKSRIENLEDDKKIWKETVHNLREQCNDLTFKMKENHKNYEMNLKHKETEISKYKNEMENLKNKFIISIGEKETSNKHLAHLNKSIRSDVTDLKTLLKTSLQNERKLKKTVLELNDVVTTQNKNILNYKSDINDLKNEFNAIRNRNKEIKKQYETNNVIKNNLQEKILSLKQNNADLQNKNNEISHEMQIICNQFKDLQKENEKSKKSKNELQEQIKQNLDEINELNDKIKVKTVMLNDQNETIAALKEDKNDLKDSIDAYVDKEKDLMSKQNKLSSEIDDLKDSCAILQKEVDGYNNSEQKHELESYKNKANEYYQMYQDFKDKLKEKEDIVHYVTNEVQEMKKMWEKEKKNIKDKYETQLDEKTKVLNNSILELTATKQERDVLDNKLNSEMICRQKWEKQCAKINAQKVGTEQEMRLILTEMERYKKTAAQFAKAFNI